MGCVDHAKHQETPGKKPLSEKKLVRFLSWAHPPRAPLGRQQGVVYADLVTEGL